MNDYLLLIIQFVGFIS